LNGKLEEAAPLNPPEVGRLKNSFVKWLCRFKYLYRILIFYTLTEKYIRAFLAFTVKRNQLPPWGIEGAKKTIAPTRLSGQFD
jgi:hypothetical protein